MKRARKTIVKVNHFKDKLCNAFRIQDLSCANKSNSDNIHETSAAWKPRSENRNYRGDRILISLETDSDWRSWLHGSLGIHYCMFSREKVGGKLNLPMMKWKSSDFEKTLLHHSIFCTNAHCCCCLCLRGCEL